MNALACFDTAQIDTTNESDFSHSMNLNPTASEPELKSNPSPEETEENHIERVRLTSSPSLIKRSPSLPDRNFQKTSTQQPHSSRVLAEWNGYVTSIDPSGYSFYAALTGVIGTGVQGEEEIATIPVDYVSEWDRELLKPGHFFRLSVIFALSETTKQPIRYTQVVFRRLPAYNQRDLDKAKERAQLLAQQLRVE